MLAESCTFPAGKAFSELLDKYYSKISPLSPSLNHALCCAWYTLLKHVPFSWTSLLVLFVMMAVVD